MIRILSKKLKNDQITCRIPANTIPSVILPEEARVEKVIDPTDKRPSAKIGEKSTIPIRVKESFLNQFK